MCVFCGLILRLLYLLQLNNNKKTTKKGLFIRYLSSPTLPLMYKYCNAHSSKILFNNYCFSGKFVLCPIVQKWPVALWCDSFIHIDFLFFQ